MKRILTFLLCCVALTSAAQSIPDEALYRAIREVPQRAGINLRSYEFNPLHDTPAPAGYQPFYISHYGRHGSRSNSDGHNYLRLIKQLEAARKDGALTADGEHLLEVTRCVNEANQGMSGRLTPRGREEHRRLAERMYRRYSAVFRKGSRRIFAASSIVPRCLVSMNAFTMELKALQRNLDIDIDTGERFMEYIGKSGSSELRNKVRAINDSIEKAYVPDTLYVLTRLFKDPAAARRYVPSATKLTRDVFNTAKSTDAFDIEENLFRYLNERDVWHWASQASLNIYLCQANSEAYGAERMKRASDLAGDIVRRADEVIAGAPRSADLRFGHDFPFIGLVSYLGLEGVSRRLSADVARGEWDGSRYTPFAANLQMVFYRNRKKEVLVKFLMNEKETLIPELSAVKGPYYRWDDVKALIASRPKE